MGQVRDASRTNALPNALGRLRVALEAAYESASREVGLSPQQAELLCAAMRPSAVNELAVVLRCDRSNVSRLADRIEAQGLLARIDADEDGRVSVIELTPAGHELARQFINRLAAQTASLRRSWSLAKQQRASQLLSEISSALEEAATGPTSVGSLPRKSGRRLKAWPN